VPYETVWELEHHTAAKHEILRRYLGAWFPVLTHGGWNRRVIFFDGFAGPGIYDKGEPGSPIIALDTLVSHKMFEQLHHTEFVMIFVEKDTARFESLEKQIALFWQKVGGQPSNIKVLTVNDEFVTAATDLLETLAEAKKQLAPTFAFIDPFGWSGVPLDVICRLLAYDKCEVFFNLMYDSMNRFLTHEQTAHHRRELFGGTEYLNADGLNPAERNEFLHELYGRKLQEVGGFKYVHRFEMLNRQNHTVYSLFFGSRSLDGLRIMKDAMWGVDPVGGMRFSDRLAGQPVLFGDEPDYGPLRHALLDRFAGRDVAIEELEEFTLVETPYKLGGLKSKVLKPMQLEEHTVEGVEQRRPGQFPPGTIIRFVTPTP
jgi:three-Cys-motif partner protein